MLNVTMHWYGFQMLTIRFELLVVATATEYVDEQAGPVLAQLRERGVGLLGRREAAEQRVRARPC